MKTIIKQLDTAIQQALNEPEPHDYYERLVLMQGLVKKLRAESEDSMILSRTAYDRGFSDAMQGDNFNSPYSYKNNPNRHADYSFGFQIGINEYES
tara:strand:+ start:691 stop:978 length:288 start_codon:yes stop_codon:yes gene_type:complete